MEGEATPTATAAIQVREESVTLRAYPYEAFWREALDRTYNIAYKKFDASAYDSAARTPAEKKFKTIVVENEYLRLTFLPELGGRLYQVHYKPTQQTLFYNNRVLKPTPWGPEQQGGWLAAGGMEWALPVHEHGYEWGVPWSYAIVRAADRVTVTLQDSSATDRVRAQISVTLPANAAYFIVHPRVTNGTRAMLPIQFWINAQLALNQKNVSPETEFILRGAEIFVHSTGNDFVPNANVPAANALGPSNPVPWPVVAGRDLSRYQNWKDYLGLFLTGSAGDYAGAYNHANDLGIARVFPRERVRGVKLFAFGPDFGGREVFTDDDSDYFELWGGSSLTFYDYQEWPFAPGESREWDEYWIPVSRLGGVAGASRYAVLNLTRDTGGHTTISAATTARGSRGTLVLYRENVEIKRWNIALDPGAVFRQQLDVPGDGRLRLQFWAMDNTLLAETDN
ncbi:MAG: hypothetical protein A2Z03_07960 [Chloroflexi bacterium RBG_16_56_8]|nr:MAG: hypothetical protein A2Z03_07960 [Chloroflexi bacterium RBG_16_56_8]